MFFGEAGALAPGPKTLPANTAIPVDHDQSANALARCSAALEVNRSRMRRRSSLDVNYIYGFFVCVLYQRKAKAFACTGDCVASTSYAFSWKNHSNTMHIMKALPRFWPLQPLRICLFPIYPSSWRPISLDVATGRIT
jgi:hypothetical protein